MKFTTILNTLAESIPTYRRLIFKIILTGLVIGKNNKTISGIFREYSSLLMGTNITRRRFYQFLTSAKINWDFLWLTAAEQLKDHIAVAGRLLIALDDTTYGKCGRKIDGCSTHFDHAAKHNMSSWIFGHCRVVAGVLLPIHGRWACLPMAQQNFISQKEAKKKIHKDLKKKTVYSRKRKNHEIWEKTKLGIASVLVNKLRAWFNLPTLVICDSWFGVHSFLKDVRKTKELGQIDILSRLRINSSLYDIPKHEPGKRGRKKKYGKRLPSVKELAENLKDEQKTEKMHIYGKERDCTYAEVICVSKALKTQVKVVFIYMRNGRVFPLITTDLTLSAKQMIEWYSARWKIESGFKELKLELGAIDSQARKKQSVENHFDLCCLAMTTTWIYALNLEKAPDRKFATSRSPYAFADIRRAIQKELTPPNIFQCGCPEPVKAALKKVREVIFGEVA